MKPLRIYADTSVFGGYYDEEFAEDTKSLFDQIKAGHFILLISTTTVRELAEAPERVRRLLEDLPPHCFEIIPDDMRVASLREAYLDHAVVGPRSKFDAEHIANASVARADLIVSWNFRHIVHFDKILGYHRVNELLGYPLIPIHSPKEVVPQ